MNKFNPGDRVKYYGTYNEFKEQSKGTVKEVHGDLMLVELEKHCDDTGRMIKQPCSQWAHYRQCRKLKVRPLRKIWITENSWNTYGLQPPCCKESYGDNIEEIEFVEVRGAKK
jgi:hypothetical protein